MSKSRIEWTDRTWNVVTGCTPVSAGCERCYAKTMARRFAGMNGYPEYPHYFDVTLHPDRLVQPMLWHKPKKIFPVSMGDLFNDEVPDMFIYTVFDVARDADQHTYQFLTKRAKRMARLTRDYCLDRGLKRLPAHMWGLVTTEDQECADERIPWLRDSYFQVQGISCEPLLSAVDILLWLIEFPGLDWVIAGGESGPGARPMKPDWARSLRDQCVEAGVPFFFKQWGEWLGIDQIDHMLEPGQTWEDAGLPVPRERVFDDGTICVKVGKKRADCLLDGERWAQFPGEGT